MRPVEILGGAIFGLLVLLQDAGAQRGSVFKDCPDCPEMVVIPSGEFVMAGKTSADRRQGELRPPAQGALGTTRIVNIQRFALSAYDVTKAEYAAFVRETHRTAGSGCYTWRYGTWINDPRKSWRNPGFPQTDHDPVVCVSRVDALAYINWLNGNMQPAKSNNGGDGGGGPYRLPSWEEADYASAGGTKTPYYWGNRPDHAYANYGASDCFPCRPANSGRDRWLYTSPVGSFPPNAFRLFDMAGNVWQWTNGCLSLVSGQCQATPGAESGLWFAAHGGSWLDNPDYLKSAEYRLLNQSNHNATTGFRVARSLD